MRKIVWFVVLAYACGGNPWSVAGAPDVPPDQEFRTCGTPLPIESNYSGPHADNLPDTRHWPGVPATDLPPPDAGTSD